MTANMLQHSISRSSTLSNFGQVCNSNDNCISRNCVLSCGEEHKRGRCIEPHFSFKRFKRAVPKCIKEKDSIKYLRFYNKVYDSTSFANDHGNVGSLANPHAAWCPDSKCSKGFCSFLLQVELVPLRLRIC